MELLLEPRDILEPLVEAARRGDRRAFASIHERFAPMVHAVLLARVPSGDAPDLVQEVFLKALTAIKTLRESAALGGWLCALARNRAADYHRRKPRLAPLPETLAAPTPPDADEALAHIRTLPEAYRETLLMRFVEGMTGPEIAHATGLTPASVRVNLHRGMKLLRERLGAKEPS